MPAEAEPVRPSPSGAAPLAGVRVIEVSLLGPGAVGTHLADLGAEVIKVEPPAGDYIRQMTWPIIEGSSLLHWHIHRGKKSLTLDLRTDEARRTGNQQRRHLPFPLRSQRLPHGGFVCNDPRMNIGENLARRTPGTPAGRLGDAAIVGHVDAHISFARSFVRADFELITDDLPAEARRFLKR